MRVAVQSMAAVMGGTQSLHTNGYDEALSLPTERAARIALRTQQIIGYESGIVDTPDPLAGSYFVETLTDEVERLAWEYIDRIDEMGGAVDGDRGRASSRTRSSRRRTSTRSRSTTTSGSSSASTSSRIDDEPEPDVFPIDPQLETGAARVARRVQGGPRRSAASRPASPTSPTRRGARRTCCTR